MQVATNTDEALAAKTEVMPNLLDTLKKQIKEEDWDNSARENFQEENWALFLLITLPKNTVQHFVAAGIQDVVSNVAEDVSPRS